MRVWFAKLPSVAAKSPIRWRLCSVARASVAYALACLSDANVTPSLANIRILSFTSSSKMVMPISFSISRSPSMALVMASLTRTAPPSTLLKLEMSTLSFCTCVDRSKALAALKPNPLSKSPVPAIICRALPAVKPKFSSKSATAALACSNTGPKMT